MVLLFIFRHYHTGILLGFISFWELVCGILRQIHIQNANKQAFQRSEAANQTISRITIQNSCPNDIIVSKQRGAGNPHSSDMRQLKTCGFYLVGQKPESAPKFFASLYQETLGTHSLPTAYLWGVRLGVGVAVCNTELVDNLG